MKFFQTGGRVTYKDGTWTGSHTASRLEAYVLNDIELKPINEGVTSITTALYIKPDQPNSNFNDSIKFLLQGIDRKTKQIYIKKLEEAIGLRTRESEKILQKRKNLIDSGADRGHKKYIEILKKLKEFIFNLPNTATSPQDLGAPRKPVAHMPRTPSSPSRTLLSSKLSPPSVVQISTENADLKKLLEEKLLEEKLLKDIRTVLFSDETISVEKEEEKLIEYEREIKEMDDALEEEEKEEEEEEEEEEEGAETDTRPTGTGKYMKKRRRKSKKRRRKSRKVRKSKKRRRKSKKRRRKSKKKRR